VPKRVHKPAQVEKLAAQGQDEVSAHESSESAVLPVTPAAELPDAQRQLYLETLLARTADAVIALNQDYRVVELNAAAVATLHVSAEQVVGRACSEVLHCQNLNRMVLCGTSSCPLRRVLQQELPLPNEELIIGSEVAQECEVSASVTPVSVGAVRYAVFNARDLSALKVASRVRSNFVSMVSHELRTPLNSVHGFIDLLLQGHMGELSEEQHLYLGYTQEGVLQLISIVEDILFMTRSDLGQFEIKQEEVHFRSLARQTIRSLQPQAEKAEIELCQDLPSDLPTLYVDPQRMKQVLSNLVTNAIKFTPPGGTITVGAQRHNEQFVAVSVADTGYGIPVEDRQHVFERFYQSNHRQQSRMGGYGLGLSIARLIVEQHGGTISFDTVINQGTTFTFTVPVYHEE